MRMLHTLALWMTLAVVLPFHAAIAADEVVADMAMAPEAAPAHHSAGLPQFDPSSWPSQIFWLTIFFVILYTVYAKAILPRIGGTITHRGQHVAAQLADAEKLSKEAEALLADVQAGLKAAGQQAAAVVHSAENTAKEQMSANISAFRNRFENIMAETESRIESAKADALQDMEKIVASLSAQAAAKIAGITADEKQAADIVRELSGKSTKKAA